LPSAFVMATLYADSRRQHQRRVAICADMPRKTWPMHFRRLGPIAIAADFPVPTRSRRIDFHSVPFPLSGPAASGRRPCAIATCPGRRPKPRLPRSVRADETGLPPAYAPPRRCLAWGAATGLSQRRASWQAMVPPQAPPARQSRASCRFRPRHGPCPPHPAKAGPIRCPALTAPAGLSWRTGRTAFTWHCSAPYLTKPLTRTHSESLQPTGSVARHPKGDPAQSTRQGSGSIRHCDPATGAGQPRHLPPKGRKTMSDQSKVNPPPRRHHGADGPAFRDDDGGTGRQPAGQRRSEKRPKRWWPDSPYGLLTMPAYP
jgi:hypothetical protein